MRNEAKVIDFCQFLLLDHVDQVVGDTAIDLFQAFFNLDPREVPENLSLLLLLQGRMINPFLCNHKIDKICLQSFVLLLGYHRFVSLVVIALHIMSKLLQIQIDGKDSALHQQPGFSFVKLLYEGEVSNSLLEEIVN